MKKLLLLFVILFSISNYSQNFEGTINFEFTYLSIETGKQIESQQLSKMLGSESKFTMKNGAYKQTTNSDYLCLQIYNPIESKLYFVNNVSIDSIFFFEVSKFDNTKFEYEIVKNADTILGHICDKLIYKDEKGRQDIYYAKDLKLDSKYFANFKLTNKNKISELIKCVYLRLDYYFPNFIAKAVATKIKEIPISDNEFVLPQNKFLKEQVLKSQ